MLLNSFAKTFQQTFRMNIFDCMLAVLRHAIRFELVFVSDIRIDRVSISGRIAFGKATVNLADVTAGNGAVHSIEDVLLSKQVEEFLASRPAIESGESDDFMGSTSMESVDAPMKNLADLVREDLDSGSSGSD